MRPRQARERFRVVLSGEDCVFPASVFDPLSARCAQDLGYELGMLAGSVASLAVLGAPDLVLLTLDELAGQVRRICRASELPLLVDADHGYGNALNVMRTVEELETAGAAALSIEDTRLPPSGARPELVSLEEGVGKMRAAVAARTDPGLVILARTSAVRTEGGDEALRRVKAYARTGVDGIFLVGVQRTEDLERAHAEAGLPLVLGGGPPELSEAPALARRGVRVALQGHLPLRAAVRAAYETLKALREGADPAALSKQVASGEQMAQLMRSADYERWQREFLGS